MNDIPIVSDLTIELIDKESFLYWWKCDFSVANDSHTYRIHVNCEELSGGFCWHYTVPEVLIDKKRGWKSKKCSFQWSDHIFEQCVEVIKTHSNDRLRLIHYFDKLYLSENFQPIEYNLPTNLLINENKITY